MLNGVERSVSVLPQETHHHCTNRKRCRVIHVVCYRRARVAEPRDLFCLFEPAGMREAYLMSPR